MPLLDTMPRQLYECYARDLRAGKFDELDGEFVVYFGPRSPVFHHQEESKALELAREHTKNPVMYVAKVNL